MSKTLNIQYYAKLREERGQSQETLQSDAATASDLYEELQSAHHFSLKPKSLRVAVNEEFQPWNCELKDGDTVVFLQPASGG